LLARGTVVTEVFNPAVEAEVAIPSATVIVVQLTGEGHRAMSPARDDVASDLRREDAASARRAAQQADFDILTFDGHYYSITRQVVQCWCDLLRHMYIILVRIFCQHRRRR